jgi:hypothetical protein
MAHEKIILSSAGLDTTVDNYEEFDLEINSDKLGDRLVQKNKLKGTVREYQLYASRYLLLNFHKNNNKSRERSCRINLACLSPEPEHNRIFVWKWLNIALIATVLAGLSIYQANFQTANSLYFMIAGTIMFTISIICLLMFVYLMRDEYIFRSRFGKAILFLIENKKPGKESFQCFFRNLKQNIHLAQKHISVSDSLISELKMCRYLRDKRIIDDEAYTTARTAIFEHEQYKA